jgi:hypothetical protein
VSSQNASLASTSVLQFITQGCHTQTSGQKGRRPDLKMCNFCPIYEKLDFASDLRESRISTSNKFLSAVPQLLSADDEVGEAGDVTFHCEHAKD